MRRHINGSKTLRTCVALTAVFSVLSAFAAPSYASNEHKHFEYKGTCDDLIMFVPVDPQNLRGSGLVPDAYAFLVPEGKALLTVTVASCYDMTLDGVPEGAALFNDVAVPIQAPDGTSGNHFYVLWQSGNDPRIRARQSSVGEFGGVIPGFTFSLSSTSLQTNVPWSYSPFSISATPGGPAPSGPLDTGPQWFWQNGPRGLIRVSNPLTDEADVPVLATLTAPADSPLGKMLKGTATTQGATVTVTIPSLLAHFEFDQETELVH